MNEETIGILARILSECSPKELRLLGNICIKAADLDVIHENDWQKLTDELRPFAEWERRLAEDAEE